MLCNQLLYIYQSVLHQHNLPINYLFTSPKKFDLAAMWPLSPMLLFILVQTSFAEIFSIFFLLKTKCERKAKIDVKFIMENSHLFDEGQGNMTYQQYLSFENYDQQISCYRAGSCSVYNILDIRGLNVCVRIMGFSWYRIYVLNRSFCFKTFNLFSVITCYDLAIFSLFWVIPTDLPYIAITCIVNVHYKLQTGNINRLFKTH